MKKLLILLSLTWLTGCVTYHYPETTLEDDVYYGGDGVVYAIFPDRNTGVTYYPWSSLDYFYLGYNPYRRYGFGYGYDNGFSYGIRFGYSPWYYPYSYYGHYSPWSSAAYHYPYYPTRRPYYGYCSRHDGCGQKNRRNRRGNGDDRYGENDRDNPGRRDGNDVGGNVHPVDRIGGEDYIDSGDRPHVNRRVSTAPPGHSSDRDLEIRSRESAKIGMSRLEPIESIPAGTVVAAPSNPRVVQPDHSTRRTGNGSRDVSPTRSKDIVQPSGRPPASSTARPPSAPKPKTSSGGGNRTVPIPSTPSKRESGNSISKQRKNHK
jgi:hypothetical protein